LSRAIWLGFTSIACGSCAAPTRLSTATRAPPTSPTSAFKSVVVAATCRRCGAPAPHRGPARAAVSASGAAKRRTARPLTYFFVNTDFGIMQCTPLRTSTTCETRQSPTIETSEYAS